MSKFGVDIGGTTIKIGLFNENNEIIKKQVFDTKPERPFSEIAKELAMTIVRMSGGKVSFIGVGSPGIIKNGNAVNAGNFPGSGGRLPWKSELTKYFPKVGISVHNDGACAAWAEYMLGAGKGANSMIMLTFGTGVGGGIILGGKLLDAPCELGHIIIDSNGNECTCGQKGCLEAYLNAHNYNVSKDKDKLHKILADSIISLTNIFGADIFVLGGGLANIGNKFLEPICADVANNMRAGYQPPAVHLAKLPEAGILGAMLLC
jgi:predicted NBD/HSP70 family sugar kinase